MLNIKTWIDEVRLKMNPSKTEFIYFRHMAQPRKCTVNSLDVVGDLILRSDLIRYLGVWMDQHLNFKQQSTKKCQAAMPSFMKIRSIRPLLTSEATESLVPNLYMSHLDYCNSVLYGLPDCNISKMQCIQNMCARLVLRRTKYDSISNCLKQLHWLLVKQRIEHKILTLTYTCLSSQARNYLAHLINRYVIFRIYVFFSYMCICVRINAFV